jgi:hypothetical protein
MVKFSDSDVCGVQGSGDLRYEEMKDLSLYSSALLRRLIYVTDTKGVSKASGTVPFWHFDTL